MNIHELLQPENVTLDLVATSKTRLLQAMSDAAGTATGVDKKAIFLALHNREKLGSTGIGEGIAVPHAPMAEIKATFAMLIRLKKPVDFDSIDEIPVDIIFVLLTPLDSRTTHLNALSCITRRLRIPDVLTGIRSRSDRDKIYSLFSGDT